jgi:hypothetical protein
VQRVIFGLKLSVKKRVEDGARGGGQEGASGGGKRRRKRGEGRGGEMMMMSFISSFICSCRNKK